MKKSPKKKQGLKEDFFKHPAVRREKEYRTYKKLIELVKHRTMTSLFLQRKVEYKNNVWQTWSLVEEVIGKSEVFFHKWLNVDKNEISNQKEILHRFNIFFYRKTGYDLERSKILNN